MATLLGSKISDPNAPLYVSSPRWVILVPRRVLWDVHRMKFGEQWCSDHWNKSFSSMRYEIIWWSHYWTNQLQPHKDSCNLIVFPMLVHWSSAFVSLIRIQVLVRLGYFLNTWYFRLLQFVTLKSHLPILATILIMRLLMAGILGKKKPTYGISSHSQKLRITCLFTWRIISVSKWLTTTMVSRLAPVPNGPNFMACKRGVFLITYNSWKLR